jgi:hypothetical protein
MFVSIPSLIVLSFNNFSIHRRELHSEFNYCKCNRGNQFDSLSCFGERLRKFLQLLE